MTAFTNRVKGILGSKRFLYVILASFGLQSLWVALSARYPMAFDEQYHFGLIKLHAASWSPFLRNLPADTSQFGAVSRDPSFLYHYIMSVPYRGLAHITGSLATQVIFFRLADIALVIGGLYLFHKITRRLGLDRLRANIVLLFFTFIPVLPLLAGQIGYDSLLFLTVAAVLLLAIDVSQTLQHDKRLDVGRLGLLLVICLFGCNVKYPFLPVFAAIVFCLGYQIVRNYRTGYQDTLRWLRAVPKTRLAVLTAGLVVGLILFAGSYGYNIVRYHNPVPRCDAVLNVAACIAYPPWNRDYLASMDRDPLPAGRLGGYTVHWFDQLMHETFFEVTSYFDGNGTVIYATTQPLPVLYITAWAFLIIGALAMLFNVHTLLRQPASRLILVVTGLYAASLYQSNASAFLKTGVPVAIHGRYLLPFILPLMALAVISLRRLCRRLPRRLTLTAPYKLGIVALAFILCLQGAGVISFIIASNDAWIWQQSQPALRVNRQARALLWPLIIKHKGNY